MVFKLTAKTLTGEDVRSFEQRDEALVNFKLFNKIYKSVTLIESVTTTVETIIRDSSKPEG